MTSFPTPPMPAQPKRIAIPPAIQLAESELPRLQGIIFNFMDNMPTMRGMRSMTVDLGVYILARTFTVTIKLMFTGQFKTIRAFRLTIIPDKDRTILAATGDDRFSETVEIHQAGPDGDLIESVLIRCALENFTRKDDDDDA